MLNCQNQRQQRRQQQAYLRTFRQPFGKRMAKEIVETSDGLSTIENLGSRCITPGIRCATMNSPNPLNSKPKMPSQTSHLDTFVMQLHPLIRSYLTENLSTHDKSASYRQQIHTLIVQIHFQQFGPEKPAWQPDADWLAAAPNLWVKKSANTFTAK